MLALSLSCEATGRPKSAKSGAAGHDDGDGDRDGDSDGDGAIRRAGEGDCGDNDFNTSIISSYPSLFAFPAPKHQPGGSVDNSDTSLVVATAIATATATAATATEARSGDGHVSSSSEAFWSDGEHQGVGGAADERTPHKHMASPTSRLGQVVVLASDGSNAADNPTATAAAHAVSKLLLTPGKACVTLRGPGPPLVYRPHVMSAAAGALAESGSLRAQVDAHQKQRLFGPGAGNVPGTPPAPLLPLLPSNKVVISGFLPNATGSGSTMPPPVAVDPPRSPCSPPKSPPSPTSKRSSSPTPTPDAMAAGSSGVLAGSSSSKSGAAAAGPEIHVVVVGSSKDSSVQSTPERPSFTPPPQYHPRGLLLSVPTPAGSKGTSKTAVKAKASKMPLPPAGCSGKRGRDPLSLRAKHHPHHKHQYGTGADYGGCGSEGGDDELSDGPIAPTPYRVDPSLQPVRAKPVEQWFDAVEGPVGPGRAGWSPRARGRAFAAIPNSPRRPAQRAAAAAAIAAADAAVAAAAASHLEGTPAAAALHYNSYAAAVVNGSDTDAVDGGISDDSATGAAAGTPDGHADPLVAAGFTADAAATAKPAAMYRSDQQHPSGGSRSPLRTGSAEIDVDVDNDYAAFSDAAYESDTSFRTTDREPPLQSERGLDREEQPQLQLQPQQPQPQTSPWPQSKAWVPYRLRMEDQINQFLQLPRGESSSGDGGWELVSDEDGVRISRVQIVGADGNATEQIKAEAVFDGMSAQEVCQFYVDTRHRKSWETLVDTCTDVAREDDGNTAITYAKYKKSFIASPRDSLLCVHTRSLEGRYSTSSPTPADGANADGNSGSGGDDGDCDARTFSGGVRDRTQSGSSSGYGSGAGGDAGPGSAAAGVAAGADGELAPPEDPDAATTASKRWCSRIPGSSNDASRPWISTTYSCDHDAHPAQAGWVRMDSKTWLIASNQYDCNFDASNPQRTSIRAKIVYTADINPGGWVPTALVRSLTKKSFPAAIKALGAASAKHFNTESLTT